MFATSLFFTAVCTKKGESALLYYIVFSNSFIYQKTVMV